jgi:hypothetical protein
MNSYFGGYTIQIKFKLYNSSYDDDDDDEISGFENAVVRLRRGNAASCGVEMNIFRPFYINYYSIFGFCIFKLRYFDPGRRAF